MRLGARKTVPAIPARISVVFSIESDRLKESLPPSAKHINQHVHDSILYSTIGQREFSRVEHCKSDTHTKHPLCVFIRR